VTPCGPSPEPRKALAHLRKHPGSRSEQIAIDLGTLADRGDRHVFKVAAIVLGVLVVVVLVGSVVTA